MTILCTSFAFVLAILQTLGVIHASTWVYALLLLPLAVNVLLAALSIAILVIASFYAE